MVIHIYIQCSTWSLNFSRRLCILVILYIVEIQSYTFNKRIQIYRRDSACSLLVGISTISQGWVFQLQVDRCLGHKSTCIIEKRRLQEVHQIYQYFHCKHKDTGYLRCLLVSKNHKEEIRESESRKVIKGKAHQKSNKQSTRQQFVIGT